VQLEIVDAPGVAAVISRCVSDAQVRDREGRTGLGFTNLKRIIGRPNDFDLVVRELAKTVPGGHALGGADEGSWALIGALASKVGVPAVLIRRNPKKYFVSYGDDPTVGDGRLVGERLPRGTRIHLVDDLVYSGETLRNAVDALQRVDLTCTSASAILWTARAQASRAKLGACGLQRITCLVSQ
jgi:adenine/guanine phosphoribosyltransferase-like PRPP-binding protein